MSKLTGTPAPEDLTKVPTPDKDQSERKGE